MAVRVAYFDESMGPFEAIVVLIIVGFLMLAAEVFVPGMVLGLLGGLCLSGAVIVAFRVL